MDTKVWWVELQVYSFATGGCHRDLEPIEVVAGSRSEAVSMAWEAYQATNPTAPLIGASAWVKVTVHDKGAARWAEH